MEIHASAAQAAQRDRAEHLSRQLLRGARQQLEQPALYTRRAVGYRRISYRAGT